VIDPEVLIQELEALKAQKIPLEKRFFISYSAHLILPYHKKLDLLQEKKDKIGTTGRGIGPCYIDKVARLGIRVCDLLSEKTFKTKLIRSLEQKNEIFRLVYNSEGFEVNSILKNYLNYADELKKYFSDVESLVSSAEQEDKEILLEGAQGSLLDISYGTYPYVTSSNTIASGVATGVASDVTMDSAVVGVAKAYLTRVGNGPFPTELAKQERSLLDPQVLGEVGTTTGRIRRIGWLDLVLLRYAIRLNGVTTLAITKLDILDSLKEIKVCVGYLLKGEKLQDIPFLSDDLEEVTPIYETFKGWNSSTKHIRDFDNFPPEAKTYLKKISDFCKVPIFAVSVGPKRDQISYFKNLKQLGSS
jgi:adenylosuccinate synthase